MTGVTTFSPASSTGSARRRCRMFLYHIPPQTVLGLSLDLVGRLIKAYPDTVVGLKDSSGDWNNTAALARALSRASPSSPAPRCFCSTGCAMAGSAASPRPAMSTCPGIRKVYENWQTPQADQLQAEITLARKTIQAYPMVPALKRIVAHFHHDPDWAAVRPPMVRAHRGAVEGAARRPREDRLHPRRAAPRGGRIGMLAALLARKRAIIGVIARSGAPASAGERRDAMASEQPAPPSGRRSTTRSRPANLAPLWEKLHQHGDRRAGAGMPAGRLALPRGAARI